MNQTIRDTSRASGEPSQRTIHVTIPVLIAIISAAALIFTGVSAIIAANITADVKNKEKQEEISQVKGNAEIELTQAKEEEYSRGYSDGVAKAHIDNSQKFLEEYNRGYSDCETKMREEYAQKLIDTDSQKYQEGYDAGYKDGTSGIVEESSESNGTSLFSLIPVNSGGWNPNEGVAKDSLGNEYSETNSYLVANGESYAEYYINGEYNIITGKIAAHESMREGAYAQLKIYTDDNQLIFTTPQITRKTELITIPKKKISGVKWIKFELSGSSSWADGYWISRMLLLDFELSK